MSTLPAYLTCIRCAKIDDTTDPRLSGAHTATFCVVDPARNRWLDRASDDARGVAKDRMVQSLPDSGITSATLARVNGQWRLTTIAL